MVRLSVQLDDDLYAMARAHALVQKISISKAICDLLRRRVPTSGPNDPSGFDPVTGLPVVPCRSGPITSEMVYAMEDDDLPVLKVSEEE